MATIDIKLKTYEQLQFEIMTLITDKELIQIDTFTSEIAKELNEKVLKEKDMIIAQRLIHNLQERIDKAIEYIQNHQLVFELSSKKQIQYWFDMFYKELLDILRGEDNE